MLHTELLRPILSFLFRLHAQLLDFIHHGIAMDVIETPEFSSVNGVSVSAWNFCQLPLLQML